MRVEQLRLVVRCCSDPRAHLASIRCRKKKNKVKKWHCDSVSVSYVRCVALLRTSAGTSPPPPAEALGGNVDPEPAEQRPIHPGSGVDFPAALRQQQGQSQPPQDQQRRQGFAEAQGGHPPLPRELGPFVCVLRLIKVLQQPVFNFEALV